MKILIITAFPPNENTAGQDYTRRMIYELLNKNVMVDLIYAEYKNHTITLPSNIKILKQIKPSIFNCLNLLTFHPFFTRRFKKNIVNYINNIASNYDVIYFDFSQVHIYSLYIKHPKKYFMCHDIIL
mgnify:CR=1 FL=1